MIPSRAMLPLVSSWLRLRGGCLEWVRCACACVLPHTVFLLIVLVEVPVAWFQEPLFVLWMLHCSSLKSTSTTSSSSPAKRKHRTRQRQRPRWHPLPAPRWLRHPMTARRRALTKRVWRRWLWLSMSPLTELLTCLRLRLDHNCRLLRLHSQAVAIHRRTRTRHHPQAFQVCLKRDLQETSLS